MARDILLVTALVMTAIAVFGDAMTTPSPTDPCGGKTYNTARVDCGSRFGINTKSLMLPYISNRWYVVRNSREICGNCAMSKQGYVNYLQCIEDLKTPCGSYWALGTNPIEPAAWYNASCVASQNLECVKDVLDENAKKCRIIQSSVPKAMEEIMNNNPSVTQECQQYYEEIRCYVTEMEKCGDEIFKAFKDTLPFGNYEECKGKFVHRP